MSTEFENIPEGTELSSRYKLHYLEQGNDHVVYEVEDHPDIVVKASTYVINDIISENQESSQPFGTLSEERRLILEEEVALKNSSIRKLREYFGNEHVLRERRFIQSVPVSREMTEEIFSKKNFFNRPKPNITEDVIEVPTIVIVQEKIVLGEKTDSISVNYGSFAERNTQVDPEEYQRINQAFVGNEDIQHEQIQAAIEMQNSYGQGNLDYIVALARSDSKIKECLVRFVKDAIRYSNETGNFLALAGKDNVVLQESDGNWDYLLLDALPISNMPGYEILRNCLMRFMSGEQVKDEELNLSAKVLNYVRFINILAKSLGMNERLSPLVGTNQLDYRVFLKAKV